MSFLRTMWAAFAVKSSPGRRRGAIRCSQGMATPMALFADSVICNRRFQRRRMVAPRAAEHPKPDDQRTLAFRPSSPLPTKSTIFRCPPTRDDRAANWASPSGREEKVATSIRNGGFGAGSGLSAAGDIQQVAEIPPLKMQTVGGAQEMVSITPAFDFHRPPRSTGRV